MTDTNLPHNPPRSPRDFLVGLDLIAVGCGVNRDTPRTWRSRGVLPAVDVPQVTDIGLWWASTVALWAEATGRPWDWRKVMTRAREIAAANQRGEAPLGEWGQLSVVRGGVYPTLPRVDFGWLGPEGQAAVEEARQAIAAGRRPRGGLALLESVI